ncbi:tRNA (N6-threonylcarbamoyladenosine(37)-N6)-methyltransferase TrmO [candidate division KSB1 bacterium]
MKWTPKPIGIIHSGYQLQTGTPVQGAFTPESRGQVEIFTEFEEGLRDIDGFDRIFLIYHCHRSGPVRLRVTPYLDTVERGLFAVRAPARPNPIGLTVVKLISREGRFLKVSGVDILDNTPLLDIKPYIPPFDSFPDCHHGWIEQRLKKSDRNLRADSRFEP